MTLRRALRWFLPINMVLFATASGAQVVANLLSAEPKGALPFAGCMVWACIGVMQTWPPRPSDPKERKP